MRIYEEELSSGSPLDRAADRRFPVGIAIDPDEDALSKSGALESRWRA